jgi:hypothetical protein
MISGIETPLVVAHRYRSISNGKAPPLHFDSISGDNVILGVPIAAFVIVGVFGEAINAYGFRFLERES